MVTACLATTLGLHCVDSESFWFPGIPLVSGVCPGQNGIRSGEDADLGKPGVDPAAVPLSAAGRPEPRITALAQHKTDPSLRIQLRKEEEDRRMKISHPSCHAVQYENIVRLATPRIRERSFREVNSPHSLLCEHDCPVWHTSPGVRNVSSRILHLANPKPSHPNFTSDRQNVQTLISYATLTAKMTARLEQLSLPRLRENTHFYDAGRPESPIRPVSRGARKATASARIRDLSAPKALSKDYIPPREPTWQSA